MVDPQQELSESDVARIAKLHVESIDDSLPGLLGESFARSLYRFLARSEREIVFVERVEANVESVCVVSFEPGSLHGRLARATLLELACRAAVASVREPAFRSMLWHLVADTVAGAAHAENAPEITYIFTCPDLAGRGLGRRMIERVDARLSGSGVRRYFVKTIDDPANRALAFYESTGFDRLGPRVEGGRTFVEFHKSLGAAAEAAGAADTRAVSASE